MTDLIESESGDIFADHYPHKVYTAADWADEWTEVPYLYANWVYQGTGTDESKAELEWRFGEGLQPDKATFAAYAAKSLLNRYVKVEIEQGEGEDPIVWIGYITEQSTDRQGAFIRGNARRLMGGQAFMAFGLETQLQQTIAETSWVLKSDETEVEILRGLTFNGENPFGNYGNRSSARGSLDAYLFTDELDNADFWTTKDIVEYLIAYHPPQSIDGNKYIVWKLTDNAKMMLPDWDRPVVETDGRSVFSIIASLCDMRRMLSFKVSVNDSNEVELDVFSFNADALTLPSGATHPANPDTVVLDFDRAVDIQQAFLRDSSSHTVEQVRAVGARKRAIFTISALDETLVSDWKTEDKTDYDAGPSGISALDQDVQEWRIANYRSADNLERVYSWFRLPTDWDGNVGDGVAGGEKNKAFPDDDDYGEELYYIPRLRFSRSLPREFFDVAPDESPNAEFRPIVLMRDPDLDEETDRYLNVEHFARAAEMERAGGEGGGGRMWGISVQVQPDAPGLILRVSGAPQHVIADGTFSPIATVTEIAPEVDWRDNLLATVMMDLDSRVMAKYPPDDEVGADPHDVAKVVVVNLGNAARLDYVAPGTVSGHDDGELQTHDSAGDYLRDDREWLRDIAKFVYEWYGVERQAFNFAFRQLSSVLSVGQLITTIGAAETEEEVNSVVTGIEWNLRHGGTKVTTGFAEIDPVALAGASPATRPVTITTTIPFSFTNQGTALSAADEAFLRAASGPG